MQRLMHELVPLRLFGYPPPAGLLRISHKPPESGGGVDNWRTNCLESLLYHWQCMPDDAEAQDMANMLEDVWFRHSKAVHMVARELDCADGYSRTVSLWCWARRVLCAQALELMG